MMSNNKKQRSIIFPIVFMTSVMFVLLFSGWQLAKSGFKDIVPVENVEIESSYENISLNDLKQKVVSVLEGGYFTVDLEVIRGALLEMPWVEDASIRRQWPSGLYIRVIEKQPVAYWGAKEFLSSRGELFMPSTISNDRQLPKLSGPEGLQLKVWEFMAQVSKDFDKMGFEVKRLVLDERRSWTFAIVSKEITDEVIVKLGRDDTANRLNRFIQVFNNNKAIDLNAIAVIDLRYPNGFSLRNKKMDAEVMACKKAEYVREV